MTESANLDLLLASAAFAALSGLALSRLRSWRLGLARLAAVFAVAALAAWALRAAGAAAGGAGRVAEAVAAFAVGACVIRLGIVVGMRIVAPRFGLAPPRIVHDVFSALATASWAIVALNREGVDPTSLITTSAVLTAIVGLSLQDTLGNILGGLALQSDRSVKVGDWLQIDGVAGRVVEITWRHTSLETNNWETLVVPNGQLLKNRFVVLGRRAGHPVQHRRWIPFYVDPARSPDEVVVAVEEGFRRLEVPGVAAEPPAECVVMELAENPARYALGYWLTNLASPNPTDSAVRVQVYLALKRAGIDVAAPSRELVLHEQTEEERAMAHAAEVERRIAAIRTVDLFEHLPEEDLHELAEHVTPAPYLSGDVLVRQGAPSKRLYILMSGSAEVFVEAAEGGRAKVAELEAGSFFGEMGMMTGEPRTATVVAKTNLLAYRLDKEGFRRLVVRRPEVAEHVSGILAARRVELDHAREGLDAEAAARSLATRRGALHAAIREFFGLDDRRSAARPAAGLRAAP